MFFPAAFLPSFILWFWGAHSQQQLPKPAVRWKSALQTSRSHLGTVAGKGGADSPRMWHTKNLTQTKQNLTQKNLFRTTKIQKTFILTWALFWTGRGAKTFQAFYQKWKQNKACPGEAGERAQTDQDADGCDIFICMQEKHWTSLQFWVFYYPQILKASCECRKY